MVLLSLAVLGTIRYVVRYFRRRKAAASKDSADLEQPPTSPTSSPLDADDTDKIRRRTSSLTAGGERPRASRVSMLLPRGGVDWRSARAKVPPLRQIWMYLKRPRSLMVFAAVVFFVLWWTVLRGTAEEVQRYDWAIGSGHGM